MATTTTRLGLRKPDPDPVTGDFVDAQLDVNDNMDNLDGKMPLVVCTSGTRPGSPYQGQPIFETDTGNVLFHNGTGWKRLLSEGGTNWPTFIQVERASATNGAFSNFLTGDSQSRWFIQIDGKQWWGSGSSAHDVNLYRASANMLATDDSLTVGGLLIPSVGFLFSQRIVYTAGGNFTKGSFSGIRGVMVKSQGAGGGSGGVAATSAQAAVSGAGGGGGYCEEWIPAASLAASETVTVGAGGSAGASGANAGGNGGASSFGSFHSAGGGGAGSGGAANTTAASTSGGAGGTATGGDFNCKGGDGANGLRWSASIIAPAQGGDSVMAGVKRPSSSVAVGGGLGGYAFGGGAAGAFGVGTQSAQAGAAGADGIVIVDVYV